MKKIISNSLEDGVKPKVLYNAAKLSHYFNLKDPAPQKYKSNLVYKCTCPQVDCHYLFCECSLYLKNCNMQLYTVFESYKAISYLQ